MDRVVAPLHHSRMPRAITRLSDCFGQYDLMLICTRCGNRRATIPAALARSFGWDALLEDVVKHLRCSKCNAKACRATTQRPRKPRGYSSLPK
jgi:hypothetical protein